MAENRHGFKLIEEREVAEINSLVRRYQHVKSGAELLSLSNDDPNKVFGVTFRTPPQDSTGIAHILEHSVLCGSQRFPVKEPFVELLKGSLQTFLNAFTYPDKTCYPVASQVTRDLYNLAQVYLDAVFHPLITPEIFQQEGWHYELGDMHGPLTCKGVVYNEMRGVYSSPDSLLHEYSQQLLFPDSTYGLDSGGDPDKIPSLTYEQFKDFHRRYYHPSNARIWIYGDHPEEERLEFLDRYLGDFKQQPPLPNVELQPARELCTTEVRSYAVTEDDGENGCRVTVNWLLPETVDPEQTLSLIILENALLGLSSSPLRKKLIDSGYGEKLTGVGLETELRQLFFSTGLQGVPRSKTAEVEALILETLEEVAAEGFDKEVVEAACNTVEFALRENNTGSFPKGLALMLSALTTWLYDEDPFLMLEFDKPLRSAVVKSLAGNGYLEQLISDHLVNNRHRVTLLLEPDSGLSERIRRQEEQKLKDALQQMSEQEKQDVMDTAERLRARQEAPDPVEALRTIPVLTVNDLERRTKVVPVNVSESAGERLFEHVQPTNGIAYVDLGFSIERVEPRLRPWLKLFGRALLELGTAQQDSVSLTRRISRSTGGIHPQTLITPIEFVDRPVAGWFFLRGKVMYDRAEELFSILQEVLLEPRLDNRERFLQLLLEERARLEQRLVPGGHQLTMRRVQAMLEPGGRLKEEIEGVAYLEFIRNRCERAAEDWKGIQRELVELHRSLIARGAVDLNITAESSAQPRLQKFADTLCGNLPEGTASGYGFSGELLPQQPELLTAPIQVNFVSKGARLFQPDEKPDGAAGVVSRFLKTGWLWDRIRVVGGAYGAFCSLSRLNGTFVFASYRDPNLSSTLDVYDKTAEFLRGFQPDRETLEKAVLGRIGDLDRYELPDAKGFHNMLNRLRGVTPELEQEQRDQVFSTTVDDFHRLGERMLDLADSKAVSILSSEQSFEEAQTSCPGIIRRKLL